MSVGFVSGEKINSTASKDVGFFGIFSGEQKKRIDLGGAEDKTHRLAIAYFDTIDPDLEFKKWVWLSLPNGVKVKAEIASIAARLNISSNRIIELARQDKAEGTYGLEKAIEKEVKAYKNDLLLVKGFYHLVSKFLQSAELKRSSLEGLLFDVNQLDFSEINNKDIRKVCIKYKKNLLITLNDLNDKNFKKSTLRSLPSSEIVKQNNARAKDKIEKRLKEFDFELFHIDRNFSIKISAPKNVVRALWNPSHNLVHDVAQKIGKATGRRGIRLQLFDNDVKNRFAILTDGNIYHQKPSATDDYVPYSKDKKTWLLLNVNSLASRLYLKPEDIRKGKKRLNELIDQRMEQIESCKNELHILISKISNQVKNVAALKKDEPLSKTIETKNLFKFINAKDPLRLEFTKLATSVLEILNDDDTSQMKSKLKAELKEKFWWNPLEMAFSDKSYDTLEFTTNR